MAKNTIKNTTVESADTALSESQKVVEESISNVADTVTSSTELLLNWIGIEQTQWLANTWIQALLILMATFVLAVFLKGVLKFINKRIAHKTKTHLDNKIISLLENPLVYSVLLLGLATTSSVLAWSNNGNQIVVNILLSLFWVMWGVTCRKLVQVLLHFMAYQANKNKMIRPQTLPLFSNLSLVLIFILFFYLVLVVWGVDMTALIASAGVLGLAIGFAAKDTLSNLFSGVFILADQPYKMGDFIVLDTGERGEITHIGIRSTRMLTRDDVEVTIPNAIMGNTKIINESGGPYKKFRIRLKVGVGYGTEVDKVRKILLDVASQNTEVCQSPEPRVRFRTFGASSLDFELLCWVIDPVLRGRVLDSLNEAVYNSFMAEDIEIPYQKQDLYVKSLPHDFKL